MASQLKEAIKTRTAQPVRGQEYGLSTVTSISELPEQAGALPEPLQVIARNYIGARRRSGEALLDAARWLSEARAQAKHGEWQLFLEATGTSDDAAERLLNIHTKAMQLPAFADAIRANIFSPTVASLLARESTPPEVVRRAAGMSKPPTKREIEQEIRQSKIRTGADFPPPSVGALHATPASSYASPESSDNAQPHWFEPTRGRFVATAELAKWCAEQFAEIHNLASPEQRAAMADAAESLIAELKELISVLR